MNDNTNKEVSIIKVASESVKSNEKFRDNIKDFEFSQRLWSELFNIKTPSHFIKQRKISSQDGGLYADYFEPSYTISELNRLFPNWEIKNLQAIPFAGGKAVMVIGELGCPIIQSDGTQRMVWRSEIGGAEIQYKSGSELPSNPDNVAKSAFSDWIKRAGRLFGIGWDLWEQSPTEEQVEKLEKHIADWAKKDKVRERFKVCKRSTKIISGDVINVGAEDFINNLPTRAQLEEFQSFLSKVPPDFVDNLWDKFQMYNKDTIIQLINFIKTKVK